MSKKCTLGFGVSQVQVLILDESGGEPRDFLLGVPKMVPSYSLVIWLPTSRIEALSLLHRENFDFLTQGQNSNGPGVKSYFKSDNKMS